MKVKLAKWGNSVGLRIPKAAVEAAGIESDTEFDVIVEGRDLRLKRSVRVPYYRLEDLVAEMDRLGPENKPELVDWGPDVGSEIIDDDYSRGIIKPPSGGPGVGRSKANARTGAERSAPRRRANR